MSRAARNKIYVMLEKASPMCTPLHSTSFFFLLRNASCTGNLQKLHKHDAEALRYSREFVCIEAKTRKMSWKWQELAVLLAGRVSREHTIKRDHASTALRFLCVHRVLQPLINRKHCTSNTPCVFLLEHLYHGSQLDSTPNEVLESYISIIIAVP